MKNLLFYSSLFLTATFISCNTTKKLAAKNTGGSEWLFLKQWIPAEAEGIKAPENTRAFLAFTPGEKNLVSGSTGCNRVNGSFDLSEDHQVKFSPLATTRMACPDESVSAFESKLLEALNRATEWSADSIQLLLKNGDSILAKFIARELLAIEQEKLNGSWELKFINGNDLPLNELYPEKKPTIIFSLPSLQVGGNSSCNGYGTEVKIDGNTISFKDPISTMMACPGNGEQLFFKTLKSVTSYKIETDNSLTFFAGDKPVMRFGKK
jgi:heat shock protein HslJ